MEMFELMLALAFGVALATFIGTRLNSGLSRQQRKDLTSTSAKG